MSLVAVSLICLLVALEGYQYVAGSSAYHDHLAVDVGIASKVPVNLNITFPSMRCQGTPFAPDLYTQIYTCTNACTNM